MAKYVEKEITQPVDLCNSQGSLNQEAIGWSRNPLHNCNLTGGWPRRKKWNYWCITTDDFLFSVTLTDIDYIGLAFAYFLDYKKKELLEKTIITPLGIGCSLSKGVEEPVIFNKSSMPFSIVHSNNNIIIQFDCPSLQGKHVNAHLTITKPNNHETLNVVIPWSNSRFQFTSKQNTMPAEGTVSIDGKDHIFESGMSWACLDFGRGLWPYKTSWNWASASGRQGENIIGLNLGGKWTDGTGMNENGICLDGRLFKISEDLVWEYERVNFMRPWRITAENSGMVNLEFTPFFEKISKTNLGLIKAEGHQCFGYFSGELNVDNRNIKINNLMGWAEEHIALW